MKVGKTIRTVAVGLVISLTLGVMQPISLLSFAEEPEQQDNFAAAEEAAKPTILRELVKEREENIKRFEMSDGTITAVSYDTAVHYMDNGEWKDIDNSLGEDNEDDIAGYSNAENSFKVKLAEESDSDYLMKLTNGEYQMTWIVGDVATDIIPSAAESETPSEAEIAEEDISLQNEIIEESSESVSSEIAKNEKKKADKEDKKDKKEKKAKKTKLKIYNKNSKKYEESNKEKNPKKEKSPVVAEEGLEENESIAIDSPTDNKNYNEDFSLKNEITTAATYEGVFDNVNIEYMIDGNTLKENIIINKKLDDYRFDFTINAPDLELRILEDGSIAAYPTNIENKEEAEPKFTVPVPFMYDNNEQSSSDVHFELKHNTDGSWVLTTICTGTESHNHQN